MSGISCKAQSISSRDKYKLAWQDDFNGTQLDTLRWNYRQENIVRGFAKNLRSNIELTEMDFCASMPTGKGIIFLLDRYRQKKVFCSNMDILNVVRK
jgi:hypothetical protein